MRTVRLVSALLCMGMAPSWTACASAAGRDASQLSFSVGFDYSTGEYGENTSTDVWYVPFTTKYKARRVTYKLTVPYVRVTGPGVLAAEGVVVSTSTGRRGTEEGVGDVLGSTSFNLFSGAGKAPMINFGIKLKFATADEDKALGTGEEDVALQLDFADQLGRSQIFGTVGYKWRGNSDELELEDGAYVSLGGGYRFKPKISGGLMFDFKEASSEGSEDKRALILYVSQKLNGRLGLTWYALGGLSDASPDAEVGMQFTYRR